MPFDATATIPWHLQFAMDNMSRQGAMQHKDTFRMTTHTIILPHEGGIHEGRCKFQGTKTIRKIHEGHCKFQGTKTIRKICPLLRALWLNAFALSSQIHNSHLLVVRPNNVWLVTQGVKLHVEVFGFWGQSTTSRAPNGTCLNQIPAPQSRVVQETHQWMPLPKCSLPTIQPNHVCVGTRRIPQGITDNRCHTHCVPIRTESGLGCPPLIHHNLNTVYDIALGGDVPKNGMPQTHIVEATNLEP